MRGYWGPRNISCICCHSGPKEKFWCRSCDHVIKAPLGWSPRCPFCRQPMENMGHKWPVGKKGKRTGETRSEAARRWRLKSPGEDLLERLLKEARHEPVLRRRR
jgi:hypothetical protein